MRLAKVLGGVGRLLIWVGSIVLLFVAYQLWGTNIAEARAQDDLERSFEELLATTTTTTSTSTTTESPPTTGADPEPTTTTTAPPPPPPPDDGEAAARIVIPEIGVDKIVVEGVSRSDLREGPGHYPDTPMPGQSGNAAIAGHRTTYGAPFHRVDELEPGDQIQVTTVQGAFTYRVMGTEVVSPRDVHVIDDKGDDRLTLTSCHPKYSARQRIIVSAELVDDPAPAPEPEPAGDGDIQELPDEELPDEELPNQERADEERASADLEVLDGEERGPVEPAIAWGTVALAVWLLFFGLSRRWRRWPSYLLGAPVFALALFVFFQAVAETLPANY